MRFAGAAVRDPFFVYRPLSAARPARYGRPAHLSRISSLKGSDHVRCRDPRGRDGAFGRGPIQLTHRPSYDKFGKKLGVPLRQKPELALDPQIGADIAVSSKAWPNNTHRARKARAPSSASKRFATTI